MTKLETARNINENLSQDAKELSVGELLSQKRNELEIKISEVSAYLRVKICDIESLEKDDFGSVSNRGYVLGIVRSYAKFLKIDEKLIENRIKAISVRSNIDNKNHLLLNVGEAPNTNPSKDSFFNFLTISILFFLSLLLFYSYLESDRDLITNENLVRELKKINSQAPSN
jgi:cytoskeletal protein RodZ